MPRANRHFLPSHIWHITHPSEDEFQSFQSFNRFAPFKPFSKVIRSSLFLTGLWTDLSTPLEKK
jgi:hypothetical protein